MRIRSIVVVLPQLLAGAYSYGMATQTCLEGPHATSYQSSHTVWYLALEEITSILNFAPLTLRSLIK